jgi:membrane fusion protein (multidrug efflux system)
VIVASPKAIPLVNELPGRIAPTRIAEVRPRVSGIITERVFTQGGVVAMGDVLYRLDPAQFMLQVDRAEASVAKAEAALTAAKQAADRQDELRQRNVVSVQAYDASITDLAQAQAGVSLAKADLASAELDLAHAEVRAPIRGRIGRARITEGALVSVSSAESLATIQQLDPIYADFTQSASDLMALRRAHDAGALARSASGDAAVRLVLDDGTLFDGIGRLLFSEATVDSSTGQVTLRGEFPNPDGHLLPGMYVRVRIEQGVQQGALSVPEQAVQRDMGGQAQLYIVDPEGRAQLRPVTAGRIVNGRWVITEGLRPGDQVIVEGFQKIRPGAPVKPEPWEGAEKAAAPGSAS